MSKYIKLEDVQKIIENNRNNFLDDKPQKTCIEQINYLPSVSFEEIIKEEIENHGDWDSWENDEYLRGIHEGYKNALETLTEKLPK